MTESRPQSSQRGRVAQPSSAVRPADSPVAQPSSAVRPAKAARVAYKRTLPHLQRPGIPIFITFNTWKRQVLPERVRHLVLDCVLKGHGERFELHVCVVMPDHVHLLLTPRSDASGNTFGLAQIMNAIKGASAHAINRVLGRRGHVWQDQSFDHLLRSDESVRHKGDYICMNPVRAGLVSSEEDWPWTWREAIEGSGANEEQVFANGDAQPGTAVPRGARR